MDGLKPKDADRVDEILQRYGLFPGLRVEGAKLEQSREAWVHVRIEEPPRLSRWVNALDAAEGVLTWPNSD